MINKFIGLIHQNMPLVFQKTLLKYSQLLVLPYNFLLGLIGQCICSHDTQGTGKLSIIVSTELNVHKTFLLQAQTHRTIVPWFKKNTVKPFTKGDYQSRTDTKRTFLFLPQLLYKVLLKVIFLKNPDRYFWFCFTDTQHWLDMHLHAAYLKPSMFSSLHQAKVLDYHRSSFTRWSPRTYRYNQFKPVYIKIYYIFKLWKE